MFANGVRVPMLNLHHQVLFDTVDAVGLVKLFLRRRHEVAQTRILLMADQAEIAKRIQRFGVERSMAVQRALWIVMLHRTAEGKCVGPHTVHNLQNAVYNTLAPPQWIPFTREPLPEYAVSVGAFDQHGHRLMPRCVPHANLGPALCSSALAEGPPKVYSNRMSWH